MSSQLAANAVPSTPYATKGEQDNVSDEDVAAYFRNKFETDNVQPAMVMEYLIKLMSSQNSGSSISTIASEYIDAGMYIQSIQHNSDSV